MTQVAGQWLFRKTHFREWQAANFSSVLWLYGIPGSEKTKLTCAVIETLLSSPRNSQITDDHKPEPVVYYYYFQSAFQSAVQSEHQEPILSSIVKQLSLVLPGLPAAVVAEYDRSLQQGSVEFQQNENLLRLLLEVYPRTTIIIDNLDECDPAERGRVVNALTEIIRSVRYLVKIFVASKANIDVECKLETVPVFYTDAADNSDCVSPQELTDIVVRLIDGSDAGGGDDPLAAGKWRITMLDAIRNRVQNSTTIPEALLMAVMANKYYGKEVMSMLIARDLHITITEAMVTGELNLKPRWWKVPEPLQWYSRERMEKMIREERIRRGRGVMIIAMLESVRITQEAVAVGARQFDHEIFETLLARAPTLVVTEAIVAGAAGNQKCGEGIIKMLFTRDPNIEVTEAILMAAMAVYGNLGQKVTNAMFSGSHIPRINQEALALVAGQLGHDMMEMLLARDPSLVINEAITVAAAGNLLSGREMMEVLLARDSTLKTTQDVLTAAAGNHSVGMELLKMLLVNDSNLEIGEVVLASAMSNDRCGEEVMEILFTRQPKLLISKTFVTAAVSDWRYMLEVLLVGGYIVKDVGIAVMRVLGKGLIAMLWIRDPTSKTVMAAAE